MALAGRLLVLLAVALLALSIAEHKVRSNASTRRRTANRFPSDTYIVACYDVIRRLLHKLKSSARIMFTK
jgi:hypothetical protein